MSEILDDSTVSEIEARKPFYFCDKCGYFGGTGPRHQHATGHPPFECRYNAVRPTSELTIDALCATVKHLRTELGKWEDNHDHLCLQREQLYRDVHAENATLQFQLEQLRAENARLSETIIKQADYRQEILRQGDFRARAIQLCKDKATEWDMNAEQAYSERDLSAEAQLRTKTDAANDLITELEKL